MTIRADIAEPHAAPIRTVGMGAELLRGVDLTRASPGGGDRRWWRRWWRCHGFLRRLLTGGTWGLAGEAGKWLGIVRALAGWCGRLGGPPIPRGAIAWPHIVEPEAQPQESEQQ